MLALSDLKAKEAIDITSGRYLGQILDAVINLDEGSITGILLPGGIFSPHIFIPYQAIILIGVDVVLINLGLASNDEQVV